MLQRRDVTPEMRSTFDPAGKITAALEGLRVAFYNQPSSLIRQPDKAWQDFLKRLHSVTFKEGDRDYVVYNEEMIAKTGPQGGQIPRSALKGIVERYYKVPVVQGLHPDIARAIDYLVSRIQAIVSRTGYATVNDYELIRGTAGGIPSTQKKGNFDAETLGSDPFGHLYPAYPWYRRMRGKDRSIFVDAAANVRKLSPYLTAIRTFLKCNFPEYFGAWVNPELVVKPLITFSLEHRLSSVEEDYIGMDISFSYRVVELIVMPICRAIIGPGHVLFEAWIEELFHQPLFWGDEIWYGEHCLFSGQTPTNDFETIFTVVLQLAVALKLGCRMGHLALGDDATMFVEKAYAEPSHRLFVEYASSMEMHVHDDGVKNRISHVDTRFCRCCYSVTGKRNAFGIIKGYYPSTLAINSIIRPESILASKPQAIAADLARLDALVHNPEWQQVCHWVGKWYLGDLSATADELPADWWERLYGSKWKPTSSPAFCALTGLPFEGPLVEPTKITREFYRL